MQRYYFSLPLLNPNNVSLVNYTNVIWRPYVSERFIEIILPREHREQEKYKVKSKKPATYEVLTYNYRDQLKSRTVSTAAANPCI